MSARPARILVVDDEPMVREVVSKYLSRDGHRVDQANDGESALRLASNGTYDLIVLDVMLPKLDGMSVLKQLRSNGDVPVIVLTARGDEPARVFGLDLGADDYVTKPFSPRELAARVRTVLRRASPSEVVAVPPTLKFDGITIDSSSRQVTVGDEAVELARMEFELLYFMAQSPKQVFSRTQLLQHVWTSSPDWQDPSTVTVHIRRLRKKIEANPDEPRWLVTVWGVGYRFDA